jgi:hypothetical protein
MHLGYPSSWFIVIESIGISSAAGKFAGQLATRWLLDRFKRQQLDKAYRQSAEETIILCEKEGYPARSLVWNSVASLLRSEERAGQVALWFTQGRARYEDLQDMVGDNPIVSHFVKEFIVRLNYRCAVLLPPDLANLAGILSRRLALLGHQAQSEAPQQVSRTTYWVGRPASLGENFFGREAELDALTGATLAQTLIRLAPSLGVPVEGSDEDIANGVCRRLRMLTQDGGASETMPPLLWVMDNLADLNSVNELTQDSWKSWNRIRLLNSSALAADGIATGIRTIPHWGT